MRRFLLLVAAFVLVVATQSLQAEDTKSVQVGELRFTFATVQQAQEILATPDDFLTRLSSFDLQSRVQKNGSVTLDQYTEAVAKEVLPWQETQIRSMQQVLDLLEKPINRVKLANVPPISLIQTTGREESGAAYTRGSAIVLTRNQLRMDDQALLRLVIHELFHVLSRNNDGLRDNLYSILGFQKCPEILLPNHLRDLRITNPDAPIIQHVITLKLNDDETIQAAPVLFASSTYDANKNRSMFAYLTFGLMQVEVSETEVTPTLQNGEARIIEPTTPDFQRQIGTNTEYIIHPEEIMADNFVELVVGGRSLPDPWIIEKMREVLEKHQ